MSIAQRMDGGRVSETVKAVENGVHGGTRGGGGGGGKAFSVLLLLLFRMDPTPDDGRGGATRVSHSSSVLAPSQLCGPFASRLASSSEFW